MEAKGGGRVPTAAAAAAALLLAAALAPAVAAAAGPGTVLRFQVSGPSRTPTEDGLQGGVATAPGLLEVEATVEAASGIQRSGTADVDLVVPRGAETRTFSFADLAWSGTVEERAQGPASTLEVHVDVDRTVVGGQVVSASVDAAGPDPDGPLAADGTWYVGDRDCFSSGGGTFHEHGDDQTCFVTTEEDGWGEGRGSVDS